MGKGDAIGYIPDGFLEENKEKKEVKKTPEEILKERGEVVGSFLEKEHFDVYAGNDAEVKELRKSGELKELSPENAQEAIDTLFEVYKIKVSEEKIKDLNLDEKKELESFAGMREGIIDTLNKNIKGIKLVKILEDSFGIEKIKEKIEKIVDGCEEILKDSKNIERFLVHGDVKLESIHVDKEGKVVTSRLVHASSSENEALALVYDFGNLRGRAAGKPELQEALDKAIIEKFKSEGKEEMGKAIVEMATLRTTLKFIGYIEGGATEFSPLQKTSHKKTFKKSLGIKESAEAQ